MCVCVCGGGGDNIISLGLGGNKFFLSNLVSGGGTLFWKKISRCARQYTCFFQLYCLLINYLAIFKLYTTILSINVYHTSQFLYILFIWHIKNVAKRIRIFSIWGGGCRHCTTKLGGIEAGPLNRGGVVPHTQKWGDPLSAEGRAILGTPLSVFLAPSLIYQCSRTNINKAFG